LWHSVAGEEWFRSRTSAQHLLRWLGDQEQDSWQEIKTPFEGGDHQVENGGNRIILEMDRAALLGFAQRLQESPATAARAVAERLDQPESRERTLLSIAHEIPGAAAVATAALSLPANRRDAFLLRLVNHTEEQVRLAVFRVLTPIRLEKPGEFQKLVKTASDLLCRGAQDASPEVRRSLAGCAFGL